MRKLKATIVSAKMKKTVVVEIVRLKKHPKYHKFYKVSRKYKAHADNGEYKAGDVVIIQETRPLSKNKRWKVVELVKRAPQESESEPEEGVVAEVV